MCVWGGGGGGETLPHHQLAFLSSSSNMRMVWRKIEERKAWDQSFAKIQLYHNNFRLCRFPHYSGTPNSQIPDCRLFSSTIAVEET